MSASQIVTEPVAAPAVPAASPRALRVWPAVVIVVAYWLTLMTLSRLDLPIFAGFFSMIISSLLTALVFSIWFLSRRAIPGADRVLVFLVAIGGALLTGLVDDQSLGYPGLLIFGPPALVTLWTIWMLIAQRWSRGTLRNGLLVLTVLLWAQFTLIRIDGVDGDQKAALSLRWSKSAEDLYLAERSKGANLSAASPNADSKAKPIELAAGDWPGFRGPNRQGELHGATIATDWKAAPPKLVWKQRIGPAWSSFVVVGNRLYTQEQRGEEEAVVCLDAASGKELWAHLDKARFSDGQAGAGPRSSPVFDKGRIYSIGATGLVNCLDATSGQVVWTRDVAKETGAEKPMWGFSNSPLVADKFLIVYAGGPGDKGLLAYGIADGKPAWSVATGRVSYSSPEPVTVGKQAQILLLSDAGLLAVDPATGTRWSYETPARQMWRVAQPRQVGESSVVFGSEDLGLMRLDLAPKSDGTWTPTVAWTTRGLRPAYNDFVYQDGFIYGFDEGFCCCVDAQSGTRRWKGGRYGHGQMLLLADQKLLFVISEYGEGVLVAARPEKFEELGRFEAISGKTWNHPVIAHGRLFARNSEEIACYQLGTPEVQSAQR